MNLEERMKTDEILMGSEKIRLKINKEFEKFLCGLIDEGIDLNHIDIYWNYADGKYGCCGGFGAPQNK